MTGIHEEDEDDEPLTRAGAEMSALLCTQKQDYFMTSMERKPGYGDVGCNLVLEPNISPASKTQRHSTREGERQCLKLENSIRFSLWFPMFHFTRETGDRQDSVTEIRGQIAPLWQFNIFFPLLCA